MTKFNTTICLTAATAVLAFAMPAQAQTEAGRVSVSVYGGADFPVSGTLHDGANAPIADLGTLNPALAGTPATLQIQRRSHKDVFDTGYAVGGEMAYGVGGNGELLLTGRYTHAGGNRINVGRAAAGAPVNATLPVFGDFGDYKTWAVEAGYRQYLGSGGGITPFMAVRAGATRISAISANFTIPDASIALNNVPFSNASWVLSGGADVGLAIPLGTRASIMPEVGIQYTGGAKGNDTALGGLGLGAINDKGARWSVPVRLRLKVGL